MADNRIKEWPESLGGNQIGSRLSSGGGPGLRGSVQRRACGSGDRFVHVPLPVTGQRGILRAQIHPGHPLAHAGALQSVDEQQVAFGPAGRNPPVVLVVGTPAAQSSPPEALPVAEPGGSDSTPHQR